MELVALFVRNWGASGLLAMCIILILFGKLVPRSTVEDMQKDRDQWRAIALTALEQARQLTEINATLTEIRDTAQSNKNVLLGIQSSQRRG